MNIKVAGFTVSKKSINIYFCVSEKRKIKAMNKGFHYTERICTSWIYQFLALMIKRYIYSKRNKMLLISQIILPAVFVTIAMTIALSAPSVNDLPPLVLDPTQYFDITQPRGNFIPFFNRRSTGNSNYTTTDASASEIIQTFRLLSGIGSKCILKTPFNNTFDIDAAMKLFKNPQNVELFSKYFNEECRRVYNTDLILNISIPDSSEIQNITWYGKKIYFLVLSTFWPFNF